MHTIPIDFDLIKIHGEFCGMQHLSLMGWAQLFISFLVCRMKLFGAMLDMRGLLTSPKMPTSLLSGLLLLMPCCVETPLRKA